jgi:hypothetical protein
MNNKLKKISVVLSVLLVTVSFVIDGGDVSSKSLEKSEVLSGRSSDKTELADLTVRIASLLERRKAKNLPENVHLGDDFAELAERRFGKLSALIETDTAEVLRSALPEDVLAKIPAEYQDYFEKRGQIKGELEVIAECDENDGRNLFYLNTEKERFELYFAVKAERELLTGANITVKGVRVGNAFAVGEDSLQIDRDNSQSAELEILSNTTGEQKLLVLLVNFQNNTSQPYTIDQVNNLIFNHSNSSSVTNFYREVSFGQTWLAGDTRGWFTLNMTDGCDYARIASNAKSAAQNAGINLSAYNRFMYIYPASGCGYSGLGTLGGNETWINGTLTRQNISHELGHNFGLNHARFLDCGSTVLGSACTTIEYGHILDNVGGGSGHFHAFHKERLGWLNYGSMPPIIEVTQSGNYSIAAYASNTGSLPKALKILKSVDSSGRKTWYYIEMRRNFGFDSGISNNVNLMNGVMFNLNQESNSQENYMLDMTPETTSRSDPALTVNRTYTDESAGISITPLSVGDSGATINVTFGSSNPSSCVLANPTVSVSPSATQWITAGNSLSYTVTVTNNNSAGCANTNFNLTPTLPAGWSADGFYSVVFGAVNSAAPSYSASASASCAVYSTLAVTASSNQTGYTRTQTATVTAYVSANGSPMSGANVTFTMTKPNGNRVTASAVSAANGSAVFNYKFNKKLDPTGTYLVSVNANMNGVSGVGSTSFTVK